MCAQAYQGEEPLRHINSAFMTFEVLDEEGRPCLLPRIRPEPLVRPRSRLTSCSSFMCVFNIEYWFCKPDKIFFIYIFYSNYEQDGKRRFLEAIARKKIRLDRY